MCVCVWVLHLWCISTMARTEKFVPPRKKCKLYPAGQRCRRGWRWAPLGWGWQGGRRPRRCRTSPRPPRRSCTRARSACPCCSAPGARCRWSGWAGKMCSARFVWSQSAVSKSTLYCLGAKNKQRGQLICIANTFNKERMLKKSALDPHPFFSSLSIFFLIS